MKRYGFLVPIFVICFVVGLCGYVDWQWRQNTIRKEFTMHFHTVFPNNTIERELVRPAVVEGMNSAWSLLVKVTAKTQQRVEVDAALLAVVEAEDVVRHVKAPRWIRKHLKRLPDFFGIEATLYQRQEMTRRMQEHLKILAGSYQQIVRSAYTAGFYEETRAMPFVNRE
jgi:hypothetical protein